MENLNESKGFPTLTDRNRQMTLYSFYRIVGSGADSDEYIGSTKQPLHKRFYEHKKNYRLGTPDTKSHLIFQKYGIYNCSIILIEQVECETKQHALREERRIYDERKAVQNIVNAYRPHVSSEEAKETTHIYNKKYFKAHKDEWKEKYGETQKKYYEAHKEEIIKRNKEWRKKNEEKVKAKNKERYEQLTEKEKEEINRKRRERRRQIKLDGESQHSSEKS